MARILTEYFVDGAGTRRTCQGVVSDWRSPALPATDAIFSYLVNAIGHAFVQITDRYCKVMMSYASISDECLLRLFYDLNDFGDERARPSFVVGNDKVVHRFRDPVLAADFIVSRVKRNAIPVDTCYRRRRLPMTGPRRKGFRRLRELCSAGETLNLAKFRDVLRRDFDNRYCIVRPDHHGNRLLLAGFGGGYHHLDEHWDKRRVGTPFAEFADRDYSVFVQKAYHEAWRAWQPTLEEIKSPRFKPPLPSKYERILVPIRLSNGPALLSATLVGGAG